jgi:2-hydroxychromene-2-carboxylate isomerase
MKKSIDFYMVTISPWCYFALKGLKSLFDEHKIEINFKPVDIMSIFKENQTKGVKDRPLPIQKNRLNELKRWSDYLNVKLNPNPKFHPVNPEISSKIIISSLIHQYSFEKQLGLITKLCEAYWVNNLDVSDIDVVTKIANEAGINDNIIENLLSDEKITEQLNKNTLQAKENNVFGVPTFIYGNELFFGQDRLFMLEQLIKE